MDGLHVVSSTPIGGKVLCWAWLHHLSHDVIRKSYVYDFVTTCVTELGKGWHGPVTVSQLCDDAILVVRVLCLTLLPPG